MRMNIADFGDRLRVADQLFDLLEAAVRILRAGPGDGRESRLRSTLKAMHSHLVFVRDDMGLETGPDITIEQNGQAFTCLAFRDFVRGCNLACEALQEIQRSRLCWGDVNWKPLEHQARRMHSAAHSLADFRATAECHLTGDPIRKVQLRLRFAQDERHDAEDLQKRELIDLAIERLRQRDRERIDAVIEELCGQQFCRSPEHGNESEKSKSGDEDGLPEFADVKIKQDDIYFLKAALELEAKQGVYKTSNEIAEKAEGKGAICPRERRDRLAHNKLITTAKRLGVSLTERGEHYLSELESPQPKWQNRSNPH